MPILAGCHQAGTLAGSSIGWVVNELDESYDLEPLSHPFSVKVNPLISCNIIQVPVPVDRTHCRCVE